MTMQALPAPCLWKAPEASPIGSYLPQQLPHSLQKPLRYSPSQYCT